MSRRGPGSVLGKRGPYTGDRGGPEDHPETGESMQSNMITCPVLKSGSRELHQRFWQFHQGKARLPDRADSSDTGAGSAVSPNYKLRMPTSDVQDDNPLNKVDSSTVTVGQINGVSTGYANNFQFDPTAVAVVDKSLNMSNANDYGLMGLRLDMFHMLHTIPNIDARQGNVMDTTASSAYIGYVYNGGAETRVSLPQGYYTAQNVLDLLQTSLTAVAGAGAVTVTIDTLRAKVKFVTVLGGNTLYFTSYLEEQEDDCNRTPRTMLGLPQGYTDRRITMTGSNTYYGYQCIDMIRPKQILARIKKTNNSAVQDISQDNVPGTTDVIAAMPLDVPFGSNFIWRAPPQQPLVLLGINDVQANLGYTLTLVDERGYCLVTGRQEFGGCGVIVYASI